MTEEMYRQVTLTQGSAYRICWLPTEGLKLGLVFKIKGDEASGWWKLEGLGIALPKSLLHTDWKVGGLT